MVFNIVWLIVNIILVDKYWKLNRNLIKILIGCRLIEGLGCNKLIEIDYWKFNWLIDIIRYWLID